MNLWNRLRGRKDATDGYEPQPLPHNDPWAASGVMTALERRASRSRMDADAFDGFRNELTGIGSWLKDKTMGGKQGGPDFDVTLITGYECENRWRGSDLGGRIVEALPDEMTREGFDLTIQHTDDETEEDDKQDEFQNQGGGSIVPSAPARPGQLPEVEDGSTEIIEAIDGKFEEMATDDVFWEALCYERAYGGSAILVGADDGLPLVEPLDEKRINQVTHLTAFCGGWDGEIVSWSWQTDPTKPNYGKPETYMIRNIGVPISKIPAPGERMTQLALARNYDPYGSTVFWVHASRLLVFPGIAVSRRARVQMRGWGDSLFTRVDRVLSQYDQTWGSVANLMTDFSQGVLKVKGLIEMLGAGNKSNGAANLTSRARSLQMTRSIANILLVDSEEEFKRDTASIAGVSDVLQQFAYRLAAASDMPIDVLMGQMSGGGLNKGDTSLRTFYDRIASRQKKRMTPQRKRLTGMLFLAKDGPTEGVEPERWDIKAKSLYQLNELEKADLRNKQANTDHLYITDQVVSPEEVAASRFAGSQYSAETVIDFDGRAQMAEQNSQDAAKKSAAREKIMGESARDGVQPAQLALDHPEHPANQPDADVPDTDLHLDEAGWEESKHPRDKDGKFGEGEGGGEGKAKGAGDHTGALAKFEESRSQYQKAQKERLNAVAGKHGVDPNNIHQHAKAWREYKREEKPHAEKQRVLERAIIVSSKKQ